MKYSRRLRGTAISLAIGLTLPALLLTQGCSGNALPRNAVANTEATPASSSADSAGRIIAYSNANTTPILAHAADYPYTHYILAFLVPDDQGGVVASEPVKAVLDDPSIIPSVQAAGKKVMVSLGGGSVTARHWLEWGKNSTVVAETVAGIVEKHGLDGVGMDVENLPYERNEEFEPYARAVVAITRAIAERLPGKLLCHAPQPPYLCAPGSPGCPEDSLYAAILAGAGEDIDWLNMQYYSNPPVTSSAVDEVEHYKSVVRGWKGFPGLPPDRLVVGKPYSPRLNGYAPVGQVVSKVLEPLVDEYGDSFGGFMAWEYIEDPHGDWAKSVAAAFEP